jgi:3-oxoacyl-[acyl-carrier protein] reductase
VESTVQQLGRLDVLIPNAGGPSAGTVDQIDQQQWMATMAVHVNSPFFLVQAAVPHLRSQGEGAIVTVSSVAGIRGVPGALAYATAKGAVAQFTRALARDLADDRIRVNCVAPGVIRTRFHQDMSEERKQLNLQHRIPLHTEGTPQQVAEVVALLVTNDYITGEIYVIDGGLSMRVP